MKTRHMGQRSVTHGSVLHAPPDGSVLHTQLLDTPCFLEAHGSVLLTSPRVGVCVILLKEYFTAEARGGLDGWGYDDSP